MKYYHMIVEPLAGGKRKEYISKTQGAAPDGYKCIGVCGFHEKPTEVQYPCRNCVYYAECGESTRTMPCKGRQTKSQRKANQWK